MNPADCASRGLSASELAVHPMWFDGPSFLRQDPSTWTSISTSVEPADILELKSDNVLIAASVDDVSMEFLSRFDKFSAFSRMQRTMAYVLRFIMNCKCTRSNSLKTTGPLQSIELRMALQALIRLVQRVHFFSELQQLRNSLQLNKSIASLNPFLDSLGLLRVGGRLVHSELPYESRHPFLLPKSSHFSKILCDYFHILSLHSGARTTQALIQKRYWIISLRGLLRQRIRRCLVCHKFRADAVTPQMAALPSSRSILVRAFHRAGVDFAGPFLIKESNRRKSPISKAYLCIFVCMSTKALHLELVSELSTVAFLACFDRFTARRGLPGHVHSDCGRNFVGAARHLREMYDLLQRNSDTIHDNLAARGIDWHFNPPAAPHFGGLWEAGVKSVKTLLHRLLSENPYTFEEYSTVFARIEAVLNSRPLCALPSDATDDPDYLSPGHFLIGNTLLAPPEHIFTDTERPISRWHKLKQLHQVFLRRWSTEYLNSEMQRKRWTRASPSLAVGDVVFVLGQTTSPLSWPIGRVVQIHPGADDITRVVTVRTASGTFMRPVRKLISLPNES